MIRLLSLFLLAVVLQPADLGAQIRPLPLPGELAKIKEHAKSSDPVALYQLAVCHAEGIGVEVDFVEALSLAKKAAELGDIPAMVMLSDLYRGYKGIKQDRDLVYHWAKRAADTGDPAGVVALARCHQIGCGVPRDDNEMMRLLRKAATTGSSHALAYLAGAYLFGDISIQNLSEGIKLARQADGLNQRSGTVILAYAYYVGRGVPKDEELGRQMALKASRMGSAHADTLLGIQILTNPGYDPAPAIPYLNRGLKLEIPRAMWALGVAYAEGRGVPKSSSQALELWRRGAEKGDENAMHAYAYATYNGMGRLPDQALGFALYLTAASLGNETTQSEIQKLSDNFKRSGDFTKGALIARSIKSQLDAGISPVELGPDFHPHSSGNPREPRLRALAREPKAREQA